MHRLYLRIYLAVLASLAAFALAVGLAWRQLPELGPAGYVYELSAGLAQASLAPVEAPATVQRTALQRLADTLHADAALYGAGEILLASTGDPVPPPGHARARPGFVGSLLGPVAYVVALADGRSLVVRAREAGRASYGALVTMLLLAIGVAIGAYPVVRRVTRRLERLQASVEALGAGDLGARVTVEGHDEVARLARSFNRSAARIEELVTAHKSLLANASHELRTPLARLRMALELADFDPGRKRDVDADIAELDRLVGEILLASRLDAVQGGEDARERIDLLALAAEECARYDPCHLEGEVIEVDGDPNLLRRALRNLLDNARRYAGETAVEVRVGAVEARWAEVRVRDHGPGIAVAEREKVFEPFYRIRTARPPEGTGLGLALVRTIARRHGGDAVCLAPPDGPGALMVLRLRAAP